MPINEQGESITNYTPRTSELSNLTEAINSLSSNNDKIIKLLTAIKDDSLSYTKFTKGIQELTRGSKDKTTTSERRRYIERDYEPRIDIKRNKEFNNEITRNLEKSKDIIEDFTKILNNTNSSFNNLNRILGEANTRISRNLEEINSLQISKTTFTLQEKLNNFVNKTGDSINNTIASLQQQLNNSLRDNERNIIKQNSISRRALQMEGLALQNKLNNIDTRQQPDRSAINRDIEFAESRIDTYIADRDNTLKEIENLQELFQQGQISEVEYTNTLAPLEKSVAEFSNMIAKYEARIIEATDKLTILDKEKNTITEEYNDRVTDFINNLETQNSAFRTKEDILGKSLDQMEQIYDYVEDTVNAHAEILHTSRELSKTAGQLMTSDFTNVADAIANAFGFKTGEQEKQELKPYEDLIDNYNKALSDIDKRALQLNALADINTQRLTDITNETNGELVQQKLKISNLKSEVDKKSVEFETKSNELVESQLRIDKLKEDLQKSTSEKDTEQLKSKINKEQDNYNLLQETIKSLEKTITTNESDIKVAEMDLQNLETEAELLKGQNETLELAKEQLEAEGKALQEQKTAAEKMLERVNNNQNLIPQLAKKLLNFIGETITKGITEVQTYIKDGANEVFDSFEKLQQSIGKTLKMSSGAYDEFKQQLIDAADQLGLAIDVTDLNDAAASIAELGIRDTDLIKNLAMGTAILSESGSTLQLNEDTIRQLTAGYYENIRSGVSEEDAGKELVNQFYEIAASEKLMADKYGQTLAMTRGGQDTIIQLANDLMQSGYLQSTDIGNFYAGIMDYLGAMEKVGIESSTAMSDFESLIKTGTLTNQSKEFIGWFQEQGMSVDELMQSLSSGFGEIAQSYSTFTGKLYENMDYMSAGYAGQAYGTNLTTAQIVNYGKNIETANELYEKGNSFTEQLAGTVNDIKDGLSGGDWLTAEERVQKYAKNLTDDMAATMQNLPDGKTIMNQGFELVNNGINSIISGIGDIITILLSENLFKGAFGTGTQSKIGGQLQSFLTGDTTGANATLGKVGKIAGVTAGTGVAVGTVVSNIFEADSVKDGIVTSLSDPSFYSGVGMALGGALGGPVGSAVGGVVGNVASKLGNKLEDLLTSHLDKQDESWTKLQDAANSLIEAGTLHKQNAEIAKTELTSQKEIFDTFSESDKDLWLKNNENFLRQEGLLDAQESYNSSSYETNTLFDKAVKKWIENQNKEIEKEEALSKSSLFTKDLTTALDTEQYTWDNILDSSDPQALKDNLTNLVETYVTNHQEQQDKLIELMDIDANNKTKEEAFKEALNKFKSEGETGTDMWLEAVNYMNEFAVDIKTLKGSNTLQEQIDAIKQYQSSMDIEDYETAASEYFKELGGYEDTQAEYMAELYASLEDNKSMSKQQYETAKKQLNSIIRSNKDITNQELIDLYNQKYSGSTDYIQVENILSDVSGLNISDTGSADVTKWLNTEAIRLTDNDKYATGLEYVPYDDFPALLHKGEMILTADEASDYRNVINDIVDNSNVTTTNTTYGNNLTKEDLTNIIDTSTITTSVDNQTNVIVDLLTKILNLLTNNKSVSMLPKSLVQMDPNLNRL